MLGGVAGALITIAVAVAALLIAMKYGFRPGDAQQLWAPSSSTSTPTWWRWSPAISASCL
ncbi:MAG: hypothetical protein WDN08_09590 [Rhizomicrobium sp.]